MTERKTLFNRIISILVCAALLISYLPSAALKTAAADKVTGSANIVTDAGTAHTWETMMGTASDGNRYAGRVWADKSVYTNGQTALLNSSGAAGSTFKVNLEEDEAFQIIFSALGSSMTTTETNSYVGPMDVVLVLDSSGSMRDTDNGKTRLEWTIDAANELLENLLTIPNVRVGLVSYNVDSEEILPLAQYNNGIILSVNSYTDSDDGGVITAKDKNGAVLGNDSGFQSGTNLQSGIDRAFRMLSSATNVTGRVPVAIVMTDGEANRAVYNNWYDVPNATGVGTTSQYVALGTLLNAAYGKATVSSHYGRAPMVYGIGANLTSDSARALMNPKQYFNSSSNSQTIRNAYTSYTSWANGQTITNGNGRNRWTFDHGYSGVTRQQIIDNINYVDTYYDVDSSDLSITFTQIYEELSSGVFNPISSSQTVTGGTGVQNTPLIYVDHIGQHMEIKRIQSITLFGNSYAVTRNADGTYTVAEATGTNPTTSEAYNTAEDIRISIVENEDGTQTLRVEIDQEILPIILEQVKSETVNGTTSAVINELAYNPLRVYYTVGLASDIFLPNGEIDVSKIDDDYAYIDDATGQITFYSNAFNKVNTADGNGNSYVDLGDAHIGFKPSAANRYYYHQNNIGIFSSVAAKNGSTIDWEADEYGVLYQENAYDITFLSYADYQDLKDSDTVYTYVTYHRPTSSTSDAANAAEEVTYIVYTDWKYLKESAAFYDRTADTYINYDATNGYTTGSKGYAIDVDKVAATISAYQTANANADIIVVLGIGSHRSSRLHNMTVDKTANTTGTADQRYAPNYTYETADQHSGNDVVVWLGNNGKLTPTIATGIALTKSVTEAIGNADDTYALTVTIPAGVNATPVVKNANGEDVTAAISTYAGNILTVNLKAGETVYISGIPAGTECVIGEVIQGDYYIDSKTDTVTVPTLSQVLAGTAQYVPASVTNAPNKYGNLHITKEMTSDHTIPASVLEQTFALKVYVGTALSGKTYTVKKGNLDNPGTETVTTATVDADGNLNLTIQARQTIDIMGLPEGTQATVTEVLTADQQKIFAATYRTRNHTGEDADTDNTVIIPANANATAVINNQYTPEATTVDLDIAGTKNFLAEENANLPGGSFTFKVQHWNGTAWVDMTTAETEYAAGEKGTKTFLIENVLQGITYTEVGTWTYHVLEVKGTLENLTYDRTLYTFTVTVTDNGGQLVAAVTDMNNTPITDGSYEVTFNNTYHTAPVSIDVTKGVVNNSGDNTISKAGFGFTAVQTDATWNPLADGATLTVYSDGAGEARFTATYTEAGTYYYLVSEINANKPGWTYSTAQYRVTITVTETDGNLTSTMTIEAVAATTANGEQANATGNNGTISFVNTYDPEDATVDLNAAVLKELTGKTLTAGAFTFKVYENGTTNTVLTGTNDAQGKVTFDKALRFDRAGKYEYDIVELIPEGAVYDAATGKYFLHGMSYDATIYDLVVEVTNNSTTGELEAVYYFEDSTLNAVTFRNVYTVTPTTYTFQGTKTLTGRAMSSGEFTFWLYEGDTPVEYVTNKADGSFAFTAITYTSAGTYTYTIREEAGNKPGVTYTGASNPITVTVTVTDTNGVLSAVADVANADIKFENTYTAKAATVTFDGIKSLVGAALADNTFTFNLHQTDSSFQISDDNLIASVKNVSGRYVFEKLQFTTTGTFFFVIVEDATVDPQSDVVYDRTEHQFRVRVTDVGDGQLRVEVQNMNTGITTQPAAAATVSSGFTNATFDEATEKEVYLEGSTETHIDGQKVNAGDILEYYITYTNYTGKDVTVDIMDTIPEHTSYVEGSASHNGSYVGTHLLWVLNVAKGESVTVSFQVKVNETDSIVSNTAVVRDGVNTYYTNEVTNHTYDDVTEKDVFNANDTTISVDGKKVALGDTLLYTIRFTNTTSKAVSVTITDTIPAGTAYVADSATLGGIYADGKLTWNLDVQAWDTVTVTFQVTVTATEHVNIQNQAFVQVGDNQYTTNVVTNEHIPETTGFTVSKVWNDADNQDGIRPNSITVNVYGNGKLVTSVALTAENDWTYTLTGLDKYENGAEIVYTVEEAEITGYTAVVAGSLAEGFTITNTHEVSKTQISASKVWADNNNQDGKRPDGVTVYLLANGEHTGQKAVLNDANGWSHTWTDLDEYQNGIKVVYTVYEEPVEGYTASYERDDNDNSHVIVTNSYTPEKTGLTVQKVWHDNDDQDGIRPDSVQVELYANGVATGKKVILSAANNWRHSFTGLNKYADGKLVTYTAVELTKVNGYEVSYKQDSETGVYQVINTHKVEKISIDVNKVWSDANDQDGLRPGSIQVELYADGIATGNKLTLSAENGWKGTFADVDAYSNGTPVIYTVREVTVPTGYTVAVTGSVAEGFTITNTHQVEKTDITVSKVWNDQNNQDGKRPATITVNLYANGVKIATQTLDASMNWSYTWTGFDKNAGGEAIVYTVDEVPVDGYTTTVDGLVITNTYAPETADFTVNKVWDDHDNQDGKRPYAVVLTLYLNGAATEHEVIVSAANGWSGTWTNMPVYQGGVVANYTVVETGYYATEEDLANGNRTRGVPEGYSVAHSYDRENHIATITNSYEPESTFVNVEKRWDDANDQDGIRPDSIVVILYKTVGGVKSEYGRLTLSDANEWDGDFLHLPRYEDGQWVSYTIEEVVPNGYTAQYEFDNDLHIVTITNTHVPETVDVAVNKVWVDNNDQDGIRPDSVVLELYADGVATGMTVTVDAAGNWKAAFQGLAKYSAGVEVIYTVQEVNVPAGYTASYNGTTVTNTHVPETLSITVNKVWVDNNNQDNLRPQSITVELYANDMLYGSLEMNRENLGIVTFENLPKYEDGKEIVYTVKEANVPDGYTDTYSGSVAEGFVITNTHEVYKTQISASKVWDDNNNQDGKRPAGVTIHLLANGEHTGQKAVLNDANGWSHTWTDLDEYQNGTKVVYTVYEEPVEGYTTSYGRDTADNNHVIITNSYTPEKTGLTVQKVWQDKDNQDGIRPDSVQVELYANGVATGIKVTLSVANNWRHSFTGLDKYADGELVTYTVVELTKVNGYEVSYKQDSETGLYEVINTHETGKTQISVQKVWNDADDQDGKRPDSVTVHLLANGEHTGMTRVLNAENGWSATWTDLEKYFEGELINYTVHEVPVDGYYTTYTRDSEDDSHVIITNTYSPEKTAFVVLKVWHDGHNQDGLRKEVLVELYANGQPTGITVTLAEANHWTYTFADLDKFADGEPIVYTAVELTKLEGYTTTYHTDAHTGIFEIVNTHVPATTQVTVEKVWDDADDQDGIRPDSIVVTLLADGISTGKKVVLSAENDWTAAWTDLPAYSNGTLINYTVEEAPTEGYVAEYVREGNAITITNHHAPETVSVSASKLWDDEDNRDGIRPDKVVFVLVANGVATDKVLVLNEENNWYGEWTDLPKYENGALVSYTVVEIDLAEGYVSIVNPSVESAYEFIVTNQYAPLKTSLTAAKVWDDKDNADGIRPESIVVALLANGEIVEEVVLDETNGWTYTWTELYQYANGELIVYTVEEVTTNSNYTVSYVSGVGARGEMLWQITNTLVDGTPDTGDAIRPVIMMMLLSMAAIVALVPATRKKEQ